VTKHEIILALLAAADGESYGPIQMQTGLFMIDRRLPKPAEGSHFIFHVYHCGPFDPSVYWELDGLAERGDVAVLEGLSSKTYGPTPTGMARGKELLAELRETEREFIVDVSELVRKLDFPEAVSAIHRAHPEASPNRASLEAP